MTRRILVLGKQVVDDTHSIIPTMLIKDFTLVDNTNFLNRIRNIIVKILESFMVAHYCL